MLFENTAVRSYDSPARGGLQHILFILDFNKIGVITLENKQQTSYKEVKIGGTLYRVTSVFTGEKDLAKRQVMAEKNAS